MAPDHMDDLINHDSLEAFSRQVKLIHDWKLVGMNMLDDALTGVNPLDTPMVESENRL